MKTKNLTKKAIMGLVLGIFFALLYVGCAAGGAGGDDLGGGGSTGGGVTKELIEGTMAVSGDAEGQVSFSFEIPTTTAAYTARELKTATGMLMVSGTIGSFKIGLEGTYDPATGNYDLAAEGDLLGTFLSIVVRGRLGANREFLESYVSITTKDAQGNLKVTSGTNAQKPSAAGEVANQIQQDTGSTSVQRVSLPDGVLPQFLGTWYGSVPSYLDAIKPEPDAFGNTFTKIILTVSSKSFTWRYANFNYTVTHHPAVTGIMKAAHNSINSGDGTQQQHYVVEFPAGTYGPYQTMPVYNNIRAKDVTTGRLMNMYLDNGPNVGTATNFPANYYLTFEEANTEAARTKQRDAIGFRPWK